MCYAFAMSTIVYAARRIVTMNPSQPFATHVAVRDGRILGAGSLDSLKGWGKFELDERFKDKVILPGFVEGHSHAYEGGVWKFPYVGYFDRTSPEGKRSPGLKTLEEVVAALSAYEKTLPRDGSTLLAWGFDPIYFTGRRMNLADLDRVSTARPVLVLHSNFHVLNANTAVFDKAKITRQTNTHGIVKDERGGTTGELAEFTAKYLAYRAAGIELADVLSDEASTCGIARLAQLAGVTTATDLHNPLPASTVEGYVTASSSDDFPFRLLPAFAAASVPPAEGIPRLKALMKKNNDRLRFQLVKIVTDGSIQGLSARMRWPGYYDGTPNGVWNIGPDEIDRVVLACHRAGFQLHIHTNGDEASEVAIEAVERALATAPRWDHRHTLQHAQMADAGQFRRLKALGMCVNLFANHLFYWGDIHYARTLGPERAERMDACGTALATGVPFAIHCDAPVMPIGPLVHRLVCGQSADGVGPHAGRGGEDLRRRRVARDHAGRRLHAEARRGARQHRRRQARRLRHSRRRSAFGAARRAQGRRRLGHDAGRQDIRGAAHVSEPVPFTVIGGFLGAGKTTLLNRLLAGANGRRFAVLVNDFGVLDIDGRLIAGTRRRHDRAGERLRVLHHRRFAGLYPVHGAAREGRPAVRSYRCRGVRRRRSRPHRRSRRARSNGMSRNGVVVVVDAAQVRERGADRRVGDTVTRQLGVGRPAGPEQGRPRPGPRRRLARLAADAIGARPSSKHRPCRCFPRPAVRLDRYGGPAGEGTTDSFTSWSYEWPRAGRARNRAGDAAGRSRACCAPRASCASPTTPRAAAR